MGHPRRLQVQLFYDAALLRSERSREIRRYVKQKANRARLTTGLLLGRATENSIGGGVVGVSRAEGQRGYSG